MANIRSHDGKLLLWTRSNNPSYPEQEAVYDGRGSFLGVADSKKTRDASGTVVALGHAQSLLLRKRDNTSDR